MTLNIKPFVIPQKAAEVVMRELHMLINPTAPQDEAKTVPINVISQNTFGGKYKLIGSTIIPVKNITFLVKPNVRSASRLTMSLLILKPTRDKKVEAEESAAATIPASNRAPKSVGTRFIEAQMITVSEGVMPGSAKLISPPAP